ncbi:SPOR domain-containing protein [Sneathiella sp.]|uniref:SPOR domain-containing protein n=1 Tax=Sneathiella sp. TaxID=1964365 RepID=UPI0039E42218
MSDNYNFDDDDDAFYDDEDIPSFNRWKLIGGALTVVIVVGFGIGIWYAYDQGVKKGVQLAPPIVTADTSPVKTIPEDKGGMDIPHQDKKVFSVLENEKEEEKVETLMSPPESAIPEPAPVDISESETESAEAKADKQSETLMSKAEAAQKQAEEAAALAAAQAAKVATELKKKQNEPVAAVDATKMTDNTEPAANTSKAMEAPKSVADVKVADAPKLDAAKEVAEAPVVKEAPKPVTPEPEAKKVVAEKPEPAKELRPEDIKFRVQLGAFRSTDAAEIAWQRFQKAHEGLLRGIPHRVQEAEVKGKGLFYRLQVGAFADKASAGKLCADLKAEKQDCLVAKN